MTTGEIVEQSKEYIKKEYRKVTDSGRDRRSGRIFRVLFFQTI